MCALFLFVSVPLIFMEFRTYEAVDESLFHHPTILTFSDQLPTPDYSDYRSATTPLYHTVMSVLVRVFNANLTSLRIINLSISLVGILIIYWILSPYTGELPAILLTMCYGLSQYWLGPAVRLSTDNTALVLVLATFVLLSRADLQPKHLAVAIVLMSGAVLVRQLTIWIVLASGLYILMVWRGTILQRLIAAALMGIPALLLLPFILMWKGLTPPTFQVHQFDGGLLNTSVFIYMMGVLGTYALFFAPWIVTIGRKQGVKWWQVIGIGVASMILLAILPLKVTLEDAFVGGILWRIGQAFPAIAGTSLLFWIVFPIGSVTLYVIYRKFIAEKQWYIALIVCMFILVNLVSSTVFQKYYEPVFLFVLLYTIRDVPVKHKLFWLGPVLLIMGFLMIDGLRFYAGLSF